MEGGDNDAICHDRANRQIRATGERKGTVKGRKGKARGREEAGHGLAEQILGMDDLLLVK